VSTDVDTHEEVFPCQECRSPVFDDELYCESCGARVLAAADVEQVPRDRPAADREERDLDLAAAITDRGHRRPRNEDAMAIAGVDGRFVAVVCDGVASTANAHLAARAVADAALAVLEPLLYAPQWPDAQGLHDLLHEAFGEAQGAVMLVPDDEPDGNDLSPSTTLVAAIATPEQIVVGNVGDSRAYWLRHDRGESRLLTTDDSSAQQNIAEGVAPEVAYADPDAHTITRWIGGDADSVAPTVSSFDVTGAGHLLVCTDGLWNYFEDPDRLALLVPSDPSSPIEIARRLTDAALDAGGLDNITVAVVPLGPAPSGSHDSGAE
jgi:serine/threonine protein phosphatase PrpC